MTRVIRRIPLWMLIFLGIWITLVSVFVYTAHGEVNSPDEAANKIFIKTFATQHNFKFTQNFIQPAAYPLFPRSTVPDGNVLTPAGFIGLPLVYGILAVLLGVAAASFFTVFFTAIASVAWWYIIKNIFNRRVADFSFLLFLSQPAIIYYTARGLFPNLLFLDCLLVAVAALWWVLVERVENKSLGAKITMGLLAIGSALVAIMVRPPEALMAFFLVGLVAIIFGQSQVRRLAIGGIGMLFFLAGGLWLARAQGFLPGGYSFANLSLVRAIFPFGVLFLPTIKHVVLFVVKLFFPWTLLSAVGFLFWLGKWRKNKTESPKILAYLLFIIPISGWLFLVYGSWNVVDNPANVNAVTMGSSYVRYWLPALILWLPFAGYFILEFFSARIIPLAVRAVLICALAGGVWRAAAGEDGLKFVWRELRTVPKTRAAIQTLIPSDSVLAVRTWDKHLFPMFPVIQPFPQNLFAINAARDLAGRGAPVFAFIEKLHPVDELWLKNNQLVLEPVQDFGNLFLYRIKI